MLNENSILQDRMSNIKKRMTIAELLGISNRFKHLKIDQDDKSKYISQILFTFNIKEQNPELDSMISELADYRKQVQLNKQSNIAKKNTYSSLNSLFYFLEKNLLEISYITDKEKRNERIRKIYEWFKNKRKYVEDMTTITSKTYKEKGESEEEEALLKKYKDEKENIIDDSSHRNLELINKNMLNEYERKRLKGPSWAISKLSSSQSLESLTALGNDILKQTLSILSGGEIPAGDYTTLYSSINGTNYFTKKNIDNDIASYIDKADGGLLEKDYISQSIPDSSFFLPPINRETKYSYSFFRPTYDFNGVSMENKIIESKQKSLALKRAQEEIKEKVKEFGLHRARYKENVNNKYELKNMIEMYVNKNKLSSPLLRKYAIQSSNENLKNKKIENDSNNIASDISSSNNNPTRLNSEQKNLNYSVNEKNHEIKKDYKGGSLKLSRDKYNSKKINFSYSQKIKIFDFKEKKEKDVYDINKQINKYTPKRSFSRRRTKFIKKRSNSQTAITNSYRLLHGINKIITNNIQNINIKTNNILDEHNIKKDNYKISIPKEQIKTLILNKNKNNISKAPDSFTTVTSHLPLIKEKMVFENICNIKTRNFEKDDDIESKNESDIDASTNNFHFPSFNKYDIIRNKRYNNDKNDKKNQFTNLSKRYNLYKDNYLKMRKTISSDKKKEYESLICKLRGKRLNDFCDEEYEDEMMENENGGNNSLLNNNATGKSYKLKNNNNSIQQAIVNPNDNPGYSRYYLPRNGSMLLSRDELTKKFLK